MNNNYLYEGIAGIYIPRNDNGFGVFIFSYDPKRGFNGWEIDEGEIQHKPDLRPYKGMRGWNLYLNELTTIRFNLGEIYE